MSSELSSGLRAVRDTNIFISMFTHRPGRPIFQLWAYAIRRRYPLLISPDIIREVAETLCEKFAWEAPEITPLAKTLVHVGEWITPAMTRHVIPTDPDDNHFNPRMRCRRQRQRDRVG